MFDYPTQLTSAAFFVGRPMLSPSGRAICLATGLPEGVPLIVPTSLFGAGGGAVGNHGVGARFDTMKSFGCFHTAGGTKNGWFIMDNPIWG